MPDIKAGVAAILVNWNSSQHSLRCAQSLRQSLSGRDMEIVIVDNDSSPADRHLLTRSKGFLLLEAGANLGFAAGCNMGVAISSNPYLLFANPDLVAMDDGVEQLAGWLDRHPEAAGVAGVLMESCGQPDVKFMIRRLPIPWSVLRESLFLNRILPLAAKTRRWQAVIARGEAIAVEQPPGACLMVRRSVFERIGGFDSSFYPAWFDDVDLCRRLRDAGEQLFMVPAARFWHEGHVSLAGLSWGDFLVLFHNNLRRYFEKHHPGWRAWAVRFTVCLGMLLRIVLIPVVWDRRAGSRREAAVSYFRITTNMCRKKAA
jgi:hypothetical protein